MHLPTLPPERVTRSMLKERAALLDPNNPLVKSSSHFLRCPKAQVSKMILTTGLSLIRLIEEPPSFVEIESAWEAPQASKKIGRLFLLQQYGDQWQGWTQHLTQLYLSQLNRLGYSVSEDEAFNHIFTSIDAKMTEDLTSLLPGVSKEAAKTFYQKCHREDDVRITVSSLLKDELE